MRDRSIRVRRRSFVALTGGLLAVLIFATGCAPEPITQGSTTAKLDIPGVTVVSFSDEAGDEGELLQQLTPTVPLRLFADTVELSRVESQLLPLRIRSESASFTARYVSIPGVPAFAQRVNEQIRSIIQSSGASYVPTVYGTDAGLHDRGCVQGSATWPAADVLQKPETAPPGERGTALVCDLVGAFDNTLAVVLRTVTGTPAEVLKDTSETLLVDVETGGITDEIPLWSETAAPELWDAVVQLQRQNHGVTGNPDLLQPTAEQIQQVQAALDSARITTDGGVRVTLQHDSIASSFLGVTNAVNAAPVSVKLSAERVEEWSSRQRHELLAKQVPVFAGVPAPWHAAAVDCSLLACVAVTYDDGPGPSTGALLDILRQQRGLATFYMLGAAALGAPDTVKQVARDGHELGSHTMSHPDLTLISVEAAQAQVHDAARVLRDLSGRPVATYRPPYGAISAEVQQAVSMPAVLWNIDTNDWRHPGAAELVERSVPVATPGSIILFHDVHADTVAVAGEVFSGLHQRGFVTVTVSQLFGGTVPTEVVRSR